MAEFLVEIGIDSISLNPDTVLQTTQTVLEVEQRLGRAPRSSDRHGQQALLASLPDGGGR
jgi:pyruvate,water dikinase